MSLIGLRKRTTAYCDGPEEMQKIWQLAHVAIDKLQPDKMKKIRARTTKLTEDNRMERKNASQSLECDEKSSISPSFCIFRHQCNNKTSSMPRLFQILQTQ